MSKKRRIKQKEQQKDIKSCTYYIDGMHCPSCEILIEKKLLKQNNIESADATLTEGSVKFTYKGEKPAPDSLSDLFRENGYTFSEKRYFREKDIPMIAFNNGKITINKKKLNSLFMVILSVILILTIFQMISDSGIAGRIVLSNTSSYISFFTFGIVAGLSSCAALVGGLLLSMSKQWNEIYIDSDSKAEKLKPFAMFNVGRLISFILLGGILGSIGSSLGISLNKSPIITALVIMVVSLVMLILGLQMLEVEWAYKIKIALPKFLTRTVSNEEKFKGKYMPFIIGALTFFLPCGFTLIAQGLALTSGSFLRGALMMFSFALGTLPVLGMISLTSVNITAKPKLNAIFSKITGFLVIIFAIYNFNAQLNLLGYKSLSDIKLPSINFQSNNSTNNKQNNPTIEVDSSGVQIVRITAQGFSYRFDGGSTVKSGVPTKLIVQNKGVDGCAVALTARGLLSNYVYLNEGENIIDLGSPTKGSYKITCTMGMVSPITLKVI